MIDLSTFHFVRYYADDILLLSTKLEKLLHVKVSRLSFLRLTTTSTNLRNQSNKTNLRQRSVSLMVSSLPPSLILFKWKALTRCSTKKSNGFSVWTSARSQAYCPMAQGCFQVRSFKVNDRQSFWLARIYARAQSLDIHGEAKSKSLPIPPAPIFIGLVDESDGHGQKKKFKIGSLHMNIFVTSSVMLCQDFLAINLGPETNIQQQSFSRRSKLFFSESNRKVPESIGEQWDQECTCFCWRFASSLVILCWSIHVYAVPRNVGVIW